MAAHHPLELLISLAEIMEQCTALDSSSKNPKPPRRQTHRGKALMPNNLEERSRRLKHA
jgi:hypothetical protein